MTLEEKIRNRDTELQRFYDKCIGSEERLRRELLELKEQIEIKQKALIKINQDILKIQKRAEELGYSHIL